MENMKFLKLQLALFISGPVSLRRDKISLDINKLLGDIFDAEPIIFPVPPNAPASFPMLELKSTDNLYHSRLTKTRADLFFNVHKDETNRDFADQIAGLSDKLDAFFRYISGLSDIHRIGYITDFFIVTENACNYIREKFLNTKLQSKNFSELNIRYNVIRTEGGLKLNDITKIDSAKLTPGNIDGIRVQRDINSVADEQYTFDEPLFKRFRNIAEKFFSFKEVQKILE